MEERRNSPQHQSESVSPPRTIPYQRNSRYLFPATMIDASSHQDAAKINKRLNENHGLFATSEADTLSHSRRSHATAARRRTRHSFNKRASPNATAIKA